MKKPKKIMALVLAIATVAALAVGTFAFFTDRVQAKAEATAGTLKLALTDITTGSNADGMKPGTGCTVNFTLSNTGNKSADVKEVLVLRSAKKMTVGAATEFDLYNASDVTLTADGKATIKAGASPVATREVAADGMSITYTIDEFILNGTGTGAETETGATVKGTSKASAYVLVFKTSAGNDFQNTSVTLHYLAQAKQHRNTDNATWATIMNEDFTFANNTIKVVPAA